MIPWVSRAIEYRKEWFFHGTCDFFAVLGASRRGPISAKHSGLGQGGQIGGAISIIEQMPGISRTLKGVGGEVLEAPQKSAAGN